MTTATADLDTAAAVLAAARRDRRAADDLERNILQAAAQWAAIHCTGSWEDAAAHLVPGDEVPISGEGAPYVAEYAVADFAAAIGVSTDSGRRFLGQAVELRHRLPRVWGRVVAGDVLAWKARQIAESTMTLTLDAARWVDRHVAAFAHSIGPVQLDRVIEEALARFMPEQAEDRRLKAAEHRHFDVRLDRAGTDGVVARRRDPRPGRRPRPRSRRHRDRRRARRTRVHGVVGRTPVTRRRGNRPPRPHPLRVWCRGLDKLDRRHSPEEAHRPPRRGPLRPPHRHRPARPQQRGPV